ncbi:GTP-binding protein 2-like [Limulus polyphemus]|uniref:GTP-binding protein 2-like n=1 Tax=Limulus polyphemus TaxID=6850 RepID=A0ABM1BDV5_LIMPO|nr:GTP-binding protein 2-like [Limulus polyphemus]XP_013779990.1 GTP-binding protein 2-like [Limulus polyphemus]XP_022247803.1 GTP-binding protein 2-like [Limulus polyphemus]
MESFVGLFDPCCQDEGSHFTIDTLPEYLPPEAADGNVEYKLKLISPSQSRFEHLVTQMKWRLREGQGEAIYEIGVEDGGMLVGLSQCEMDASMKTLYLMADKLGASITILRERLIYCGGDFLPRKAAEVLVRKVPDDQQTIEIRVAVLGNMDVGKSTLLGVLTQGDVDNGRGSARLNLFRHLHEIQTGRTSSISHEILGFDSCGNPITYKTCRTAEEICDQATKLITFIDLAGHQKYMRTTVFGLTGHSPHFAMLVVSAVTGIAGTTKEHLGLALALGVPIVVVVNKVDLASSRMLHQTLRQLEDLLKGPGCNKACVQVKSVDDAYSAVSMVTDGNIAPVFTVSCVTGAGIDLLYTFLNVMPPNISVLERERLIQLPTEFQVDETFKLSDAGIIVGGLLTRGVIREGDEISVGPLEDGSVYPVKVASIHRHKKPCRVVRACESATLALVGCQNINIRKGMILANSNSHPPVCMFFQARINLLFHATQIMEGFQTTVHVGNVRQTAIVMKIMGTKGLVTNDNGAVIFRFIKHPECIRPGAQLLFREGPTKGIGQVTQVFRYSDLSPVSTHAL